MLQDTTAPPVLLDRPHARSSSTRSAVRTASRASTAAYVGVCALALAAPFETKRPLVSLPWQSVSNLEAVLLTVFAVSSAAMLWSRHRPRWDTPLTWPWTALLAAMCLAAAAAPVERVNALHMAARFGVALGVYLLAVNGLTTSARLQRALTAAVAAGVVVSVLAMLEFLQVGPVLQWLKAFRTGRTAVGSQLRAGASFQYPTIASMYLEIVFAFGLGLLLAALDAARRGWAIAAFAALAFLAEAIVLTFTRAGLLTMAVSLALVGTGRYWRRGADTGVTLVTALAVLVAGLFLVSRSTQSVWLRLTSEGQETWYRAQIEAPAEVTVTPTLLSSVPVTVTNTGRLTWDSTAGPAIYLSYHWLEAGTDRVVAFDGARTPFREPVAPGATVSVDAQVRGFRQPGRYRLAWDVVQEGYLWFSTEPGGALRAFSRATVSGAVLAGRPALPTTPLPRAAVRPGRLILWRAAARMLAAHPLLGVGPDNFRLLYGEYAGLANADPRIHSNDMYIEVLVGSGLVGGVALAWLLWRTARLFAAGLRVADSRLPAALGIGAAGAAIALHGVFDSFLGFTPTYVLIALTLGMAVAHACGEVEPNANCV